MVYIGTLDQDSCLNYGNATYIRSSSDQFLCKGKTHGHIPRNWPELAANFQNEDLCVIFSAKGEDKVLGKRTEESL